MSLEISRSFWLLTDLPGRHMLETRGGVAGQPVPEGGVAGNPRGFGKIINISSLVAFQGKRWRSITRTSLTPSGGLNVVAYAAAKHGVQGIVSLPCCDAPQLILFSSSPSADQGLLKRLGLEGRLRQRHRPWIHLDRRESGRQIR